MLLFVGFTIRHRRRSGIHRVIVETARVLADMVELDLVRWDASQGALRFLDAAETDALFGPGDWPAGARLRPAARRLGGAFWAEAGELGDAWLLAPEVAWHEPDGNSVLAEVLRQCRERGLRTAALCYDLIPIRNPLYRDGAELHEAYLRTLAGCDLVLPISRDCAGQLSGWWREQGIAPTPPIAPVLLPDGGFSRPAGETPVGPRASQAPCIVLLGSVELRKRQLPFLEAMAQARTSSAEVARYEAVVIGSVQPVVASAFKAFVAEHPWVRYLDYASDAAVARWLGEARFSVFASDDEGYGLPIAESLAAGTPCLCADFGAMGEVAEGGGCLTVDVRSQAALGQALTRLCEQPAAIARLRAEIAARRFRSWRDYASTVLAQMAATPAKTVMPPPPDTPPPGGSNHADDGDRSIPRVVVAVWRLGLAVRRKGLGPVTRHLARTLRRRGALGALRLAFADRARRAALADALAAPATEAQPTPRGPPDLDESYAMPPHRWALYLADVEAAAAASTADEADIAITFVIVDRADAPGATDGHEATRQAVAALGVGATVLGGHDPRPPPNRWVVFLRTGDRPSPAFAAELARATEDGIAEVASFDMIRRTDGGEIQPLFAPGANPVLYRSLDHLLGRVAVRANLLRVGPPVAEVDPRAVVLDWLDRTPPTQARGRWRHVARPVLDVVVTDAEVAALRRDVQTAAPVRSAPTTAVIALHDRAVILEALVADLLRRPDQDVAEVVIVANDALKAGALAALDTLARDRRVQLLWSEGRAEPPELYRLGAAQTSADGPLLFLDAELAPTGGDWLERLVARLYASPEVGAVGPLLLRPDARVMSAGMYLRPQGRAGHALRGAPSGGGGYPFLLDAARQTTALSGLALMTRREVFTALGGFDAALGAALFDVDFGRRVTASGWTNVFEPAAVLVAGTEAARTAPIRAVRGEALDRYDARWGSADGVDRLHPAGFDLGDETLRRLAAPGRSVR